MRRSTAHAGLMAVAAVAAGFAVAVAAAPPAAHGHAHPRAMRAMHHGAPVPGPLRVAAASPTTPGEAGFRSHCLVCHGPDGRGIQGLGVSLADSAYVASQSVEDLVAFLQVGRMPGDPGSISGQPMPGFAWVSDEELTAVATYVKEFSGR